MKSRHIAVFLASLLGCASAQGAAVLVSDLGWLAGNWIGSLADGSVYESHYSDPDGGVIVGSSKETRANRVVGTDFELIYEKDGQVIFQPHPNGVKSDHGFPLEDYDALARRAVFENRDSDFPQSYTFEMNGLDGLKITISGPDKDGKTRKIVIDLRRAL